MSDRAQEGKPSARLPARVSLEYDSFRNSILIARVLSIVTLLVVVVLRLRVVLDAAGQVDAILRTSATMAGFCLALAAFVFDYDRDRRMVLAFLLVGYTFLLATSSWLATLFFPLPANVDLLIITIISVLFVGDLTVDHVAKPRFGVRAFYIWCFASMLAIPAGLASFNLPSVSMALTISGFAYLLAFAGLFAFVAIRVRPLMDPNERQIAQDQVLEDLILEILRDRLPAALSSEEVLGELERRGRSDDSWHVTNISSTLARDGKIFILRQHNTTVYTIMPDDMLVIDLRSRVNDFLDNWRRKLVTDKELREQITSLTKFPFEVLRRRIDLDQLITDFYEDLNPGHGSPRLFRRRDFSELVFANTLSDLIHESRLVDRLSDNEFANDVEKGVKYVDLVARCAKGAVNSRLDETFKDNEKVTRSEVEAFLSNLLGRSKDAICGFDEDSYIPKAILGRIGGRKSDLERVFAELSKSWERPS